MPDQPQTDMEFNTAVSRLLRREALRRAAEEVNTTSGPGLESMLAQISATATADANARLTADEAITRGALQNISKPDRR